MFMTEKDYDHLFRQLYNLKKEAPCHNGICVGYQQCEYGCYGGECAIDIVRTEANLKYNEDFKGEHMKKFTMELVWHNCKTYPPKEDYNNCLYISNGNYMTKAIYHRGRGWIREEDGIVIQDKYLDRYWWADIEQTVLDESRFNK